MSTKTFSWMILADKVFALFCRERSRVLLILICVLFCLGSCFEKRDRISELTGTALGTTFSVKIIYSADPLEPKQLQSEIQTLLTEVEASMSVFEPESAISRFNLMKSNDWVKVPTDLFQVLQESSRISEETDGAFDFTLGKLIELWGFGKTMGITNIPEKVEIKNALAHSGFHQVSLLSKQSSIRKEDPEIFLNLSAIAKGYAVDRVALLLEEHGIYNYLVEIGGEVRTRGVKHGNQPWRVAIERPEINKRSIQKVIKLGENAMATSGDYRNFFMVGDRRFSHTIDPRTGWPSKNEIASVSVIHSSCMTADALATALMVMGLEQGIQFAKKHRYRVFWIIRKDGDLVETHSAEFEPFLN